jgi:hypothetical protein
MASDVRVDINHAAIRDILRSREVQDLFLALGGFATGRRRRGFYAADSRWGRSRARATVWTRHAGRWSIEARDHVLLRALDAGRG